MRKIKYVLYDTVEKETVCKDYYDDPVDLLVEFLEAIRILMEFKDPEVMELRIQVVEDESE